MRRMDDDAGKAHRAYRRERVETRGRPADELAIRLGSPVLQAVFRPRAHEAVADS